jgi:hypothetical protein
MKRSEVVVLLMTGSVVLASCADSSVRYPAENDLDPQDPLVESGTLGTVESGSQTVSRSSSGGGSASGFVQRGGFGRSWFSGG